MKEDEIPSDFFLSDLTIGWIPVVGHILALISWGRGMNKRAIFLAIYATLGTIILLVLNFTGTIDFFEEFFISK